MFCNFVAGLGLLMAYVNGVLLETRDTAQSHDLDYPSGCMTSYNNIPFGWLPDYNGPDLQSINSNSGKQACLYGLYMQFGTNYDDNQLTPYLEDVVNSGAVFVPAIMPTDLYFSEIDSSVAQNIAATVEKFTDQGVMVYLRFAHEMNYYVADKDPPTYPGGSPEEFVQAWQNVHDAVAENSLCKMFWSPNRASSDDLYQWWPGADYVDIVGMDAYPDSGSSFVDVYSDFYNAFSVGYNKHFILGETGSGSDAVSDKEAWLQQITMSDFSAFPNYQGAAWFEYYKNNEDFRVLVGQSFDTVTETLSNFA